MAQTCRKDVFNKSVEKRFIKDGLGLGVDLGHNARVGIQMTNDPSLHFGVTSVIFQRGQRVVENSAELVMEIFSEGMRAFLQEM